ncbi:MAG: glucose 1-dehydrogenase [Thermoguttaceae bacterium]|jgi:glucose 1-dehydrogenase|nr:glucose 1-dehydrogenase [Thermoguttaceae bacterium]
MTDLTNRVALVTGAGRGIGAAVAMRLAEAGADVVVNDFFCTDLAEDVCRRIRRLGRRALAVEADLRQTGRIDAMFDHVEAEFGPIDILVNNAGVEYRKSAAECDEALYDTTLDTNLKGAFFCSQRALAGMKERGWGRVISITSVHDERATGFFAPYGMSKGGLLMMTRELALEYSPFGITVNAIAPGAIRTDINREVLADPQYEAKVIARIPAGRIGEPDDVARVAVFLAGDDARYVTGASLVVDGGWSLR